MMKTRVRFCRNYYYNVFRYVHIPPSALNAGAKRSGATCHLAMPQCCYLAKGAKRPSHTTNMQTFSNKSSFNILAVTTLKASNLNSAVWGRIFIFCCMNRPPSNIPPIQNFLPFQLLVRLPVTWPNTIWLNFFVESFGLKILGQVTTKLSQLHSNSRNKYVNSRKYHNVGHMLWVGGNRSKERDRKSELVLRSTIPNF